MVGRTRGTANGEKKLIREEKINRKAWGGGRKVHTERDRVRE